MDIESVKLTEGGFLVNGTMSVPNAEGNRHFAMVQAWIDEGNTPESQFTEQEIYAQLEAEVKSKRDSLLAETDFVLMPDYPLNDKTLWQEYRQHLRDVTEQADYPNTIEWPIKPFLP